MINNQNLANETNNGSVSVKARETFILDNVFTRSIKNPKSDLTIDAAIARTSKTGAKPEDYYNCWGSAISGNQGQEIQVGEGIPTPNTFDAKLASDYTPTTEGKAQFGKTFFYVLPMQEIILNTVRFFIVKVKMIQLMFTQKRLLP